MKLYNLALKTKYPPLPDSAVIEKCITRLALGDLEAMKPLYSEASASVYGFALSILKDSHDAEDILQDVFVKVYSAARSYRPQGKPMAWILTITKRLALMRLRERGKTTGLSVENAAGSDTTASDDAFVLRAAVNELGEPDGRIVILHAVSGLKHREIAELLSLPLPTVLSKYNRALKKLKQKLTEG